MPENKYSKLFQSAEETKHEEVAHVNGVVPSWLNGKFLRTGPGKWNIGNDFTMNHFLDGFAILSKFTISTNAESSLCQVSFQSRFLQSDAYRRGMAAGKPVITEFGTKAYVDPNKSFLSRIFKACLPLELSDNCGINVVNLCNNSDLFVCTETSYFRQIDSSTLSTGVKYDVNKCFGVHTTIAHPLTDPNTRCTWTIGLSVLCGLKYNIIKIPAPNPGENGADTMNKSKIIASITPSNNMGVGVGLLPYIHSFAMTKNYVIIITNPHCLNIAKAAKTYLTGGPCYKDWVEWRPEIKNTFYIVDKNTGKVLKTQYFAQENFFYLHVINAYEDQNQIVVDLTCYKDSSIFDDTYLHKLREGKFEGSSKARGQRFVIPIVEIADVSEGTDLVEVKSTATATRQGDSIILSPEIITESGFETPVLNKKYCGIKNSYFYAAGTCTPSEFRNAIPKFNTRTKEVIMWKGTEFQFPGEPQFIANPNGTAEDDGVIIAAVTDTKEGANDFLIIVSGQTMEELGRASFKHQISHALHGIFLPD